jgi:hypothetical protein
MTRDEQRKSFDKNTARDVLFEVKEVLDKCGVEFFLIGGTLLGAVRDKKFPKYDFDIDIGVKQETLIEKMPELEKEFLSRGFQVSKFSTPYPFDRFMKVSKNRVTTDITDFKLVNDEYIHIFKFNRGCFVFPREMFDNLGEINFLGKTFKIPTPVEKVLEHNFTVSWTVEDKDWNWETSPCLKWGYSNMRSQYFVNPLHVSSARDYQGRMTPDKPENAKIARQFGFDFWDGERKYGYGGYKDDGRWYQVAEKMIKVYGLTPESKVLDIGCGKGYLGKWINKLGGGEVWGCDISDYALEKCVIPNKFKFEAGKDNLNDNYDLIISITTLHNLLLPNLKQAIQQINEHSKQAYICVESYRNERELYNLQCWALTCEQFLRPEEWQFLFDEWGYKGDYEYIFFE